MVVFHLQETTDFFQLPECFSNESGRPAPKLRIIGPNVDCITKLPGQLYQGLYDDTRSEIRWYLEDYLVNQPFEAERARRAVTRIQEHGQNLVSLLITAVGVVALFSEGHLNIVILENENKRTFISDLHWELIENSNIWPKHQQMHKIVVTRYAGLSLPEPVAFDRVIPVQRKAFPGSTGLIRPPSWTTQFAERSRYIVNCCIDTLAIRHSHLSQHIGLFHSGLPQRILLLTARPRVEEDLPYRLVSSAIYGIVAKLRPEMKRNIEVFFCRPGTVTALESMLQKHSFGYFDIVHLDVHGVQRDDGTFLDFVKLDNGITDIDEFPSTSLGDLLVKHGVKNVVLNACRSAAGAGTASNIARMLVQRGITAAIGMSFNITDTAANIFIRALYGNMFVNGHTLYQAATLARAALRLSADRQSRFLTHISLQDFLIPLAYTKTMYPLPPRQTLYEIVDTFISVTPEVLHGREGTILQLENLIAAGVSVINLRGPPGIGKTALASHLVWWWNITKFADCGLFHAYNGVPMSYLEDFIRQWKVDQLNRNDNENGRPILFIDSLEDAKFIDISNPQEFSDRLRKWLNSVCRRVPEATVILISRYDLDCLKSVRCLYMLPPLDSQSSMSLMTAILGELKTPIDMSDLDFVMNLEMCAELADGNPLAIQLLARDFVRTRLSPRSYLHRLLSIEPMSLDLQWISANEGARSVTQMLHHLSQLKKDPGDMLIEILHLAYFWKNIPDDAMAYHYFLRKAYMIYKFFHTPLRQGFFSSWWMKLSTYVNSLSYDVSLCILRTKLEERLLSFSTWNEQILASPTEEDLTDLHLPAFVVDESGKRVVCLELQTFLNTRWQQFLAGGLICGIEKVTYPRAEGISTETYYQIHPVFTMVLRHSTAHFSHSLKKAAATAFIRFYHYRARDMRWENGRNDGEGVKDGTVRQTQFEFYNLISSMNMLCQFNSLPLNNILTFIPLERPHWQWTDRPKLHCYNEVLLRAIRTLEKPMMMFDEYRFVQWAPYYFCCLTGLGDLPLNVLWNAFREAPVQRKRMCLALAKRVVDVARILIMGKEKIKAMTDKVARLQASVGASNTQLGSLTSHNLTVPSPEATNSQQGTSHQKSERLDLSRSAHEHETKLTGAQNKSSTSTDAAFQALLIPGAITLQSNSRTTPDPATIIRIVFAAQTLATRAITPEAVFQVEPEVAAAMTLLLGKVSYASERMMLGRWLTECAVMRSNFAVAAERLSLWRDDLRTVRLGKLVEEPTLSEYTLRFERCEMLITLAALEVELGRSRSKEAYDAFEAAMLKAVEMGYLTSRMNAAHRLHIVALHTMNLADSARHLLDLQRCIEAGGAETANLQPMLRAEQECLRLTTIFAQTLGAISMMPSAQKSNAIANLATLRRSFQVFIASINAPQPWARMLKIFTAIQIFSLACVQTDYSAMLMLAETLEVMTTGSNDKILNQAFGDNLKWCRRMCVLSQPGLELAEMAPEEQEKARARNLEIILEIWHLS